MGWFIGQLPVWLIWHAEQPWPGGLVVKLVILALVSCLIVGVTIGLVGKREPVLMPAPRSSC